MAKAAEQKLAQRIAGMGTSALKDIAKRLFADDRAEAGIVLSAALDALMGRLPEAEFVAFCEAMEA